MKTFAQILAIGTFAALLATGCVDEDPAYKNEPGPTTPTDATGYLTLGDLSMRVIYDTETELQPDDTAGETQRPAAARSTRTQPALDDFRIEIRNASGETVLAQSYGELQAEFREAERGIALPVGSYTLWVRSEAESATPAVAWEHPVYGTTYDFQILKDQSTSLGEVVCKLQNIKVTVLCSADLAARLTDDTTTSVSLGEATQTFALHETRAAYFLPAAETNTLDFRLTGKFADTLDPADLQKQIENVKGGQWRKIALVISYADKGDVTLDIEVDSFIQDEEIVVDGTPGGWEPPMDPDPDPEHDAPTIVWTGYDIDLPYELTPEMTLDIVVTAPAGIRSFVVTILTTEQLTEALSALKLDVPFDLCNITDQEQAASLDMLTLPYNQRVKDKTALPFPLTPFVEMLIEFPGEHHFKLEVTDNDNQTETRTLQLIVK